MTVFDLDKKENYKEIIEAVVVASMIGTAPVYKECISERMMRYTLTQMSSNRTYQAEGGKDLSILKETGIGHKRGYVLSKKAVGCGLLEYYGLQKYYDAISRSIRYNYDRSLRKKSTELSLILFLLGKADVIWQPGSKYIPLISDVVNDDSHAYFYTSREVRYALDALEKRRDIR